jgi:hypothetical protein
VASRLRKDAELIQPGAHGLRIADVTTNGVLTEPVALLRRRVRRDLHL